MTYKNISSLSSTFSTVVLIINCYDDFTDCTAVLKEINENLLNTKTTGASVPQLAVGPRVLSTVK